MKKIVLTGQPQPNPGSPEAVKLGCTCPEMDNGHGQGCGAVLDGVPLFWFSHDCPVHTVDAFSEAGKE